MALADVEFYPVTSSNVQEIGFSYDEGALYVRFHSGYLYSYLVPVEIYDEMLNVDSPGRYVHQVLKAGGYSYERIN